jgi:tetratricopeptide (TPR) repeat protein
MKKKIIGLITFFLLLTVFSAFLAEAQAQPKKVEKVDKKAEKLAKQGDDFLRKKDYRLAINKYAEAISISPNYPYAHFWKGSAHYYLKEYDEALLEIDTAFNQGHTPLEVYRIRWFLNLQKGNYDAVLNDAQEGARLDPNNINFQKALAGAYLGKKDYQNALTVYKKIAEAEPNNGDIAYRIAEANYNLGETDAQAFAAMDAIKKRTQFLGEAWFYVGDSLQKSKKFDEAIEAYENSISANPKFYDSYNNLSELYRTKGRYDKAIAVMDKAVVQFPNDSTIYVNLSWYYSLSDQHPKAIAAAQKAIQLDQSNSMGHTNLCRAYNDMELYSQAVTACNKALELNPGDGESNFYLGRAHLKLNRKDIAAGYFKKAVDGLVKFTNENPDYSDGFYLLGNAFYAAGDQDKAVAAYKKAIELSPRFAKARYNLGVVYIVQEKPDLAKEQLNALMEIDSKLAAKLRDAIDQK